MHFHYEGENDINKLETFLKDVEDFLDRLVKHKRAFAEDIYGTVVAAWKSAKVRFSDAVTRLRQTPSNFLEDRGLTGDELKLKLRNVENAFGDILLQIGGQALLKFFDVIDTLLKSVADAIGVGTVLEEIKDAIKGALSWART